MLFLLFAAFTLYLSRHETAAVGSSEFDWFAVASLGILLACVLLHEAGHVWAARRLGIHVEQIVLGPLGGIAPLRGALDARSELLASFAGPAFNLGVCLLCMPIVVAKSSWGDLTGLLHPLEPTGLTFELTGIAFVKLAFWVNWVLAILNLLPAFPFDGGRILRAAILMRWPDLGRRGAAVIVSSAAKVAALAMIVLAVLVFEANEPQLLLPTRYALILLGIFLFFSAKRHDRREEDEERENDLLYGYDLTQDLDDLEHDLEETPDLRTGPLSRWLEKRRDQRAQRQTEIEQEEERRVDAVLARLHEHGMQSLSPEDRALLERVSARYRSRLRN